MEERYGMRALPPETGKKPRKHKGVRMCGKDGCPTKLSIYNPGKFCFAHTTYSFYAPRGRTRNGAT